MPAAARACEGARLRLAKPVKQDGMAREAAPSTQRLACEGTVRTAPEQSLAIKNLAYSIHWSLGPVLMK